MSNQEMTDEIIVNSLPLDIQYGGTYSIAQQNPNTYTHIYFKYPCRFIPEIPRWAIKKYLNKKDAIVFDPFAGSGTTLLESNILGYNAYGTEVDIIAKLIIKVKTTSLTNTQLNSLSTIYETIIYGVQNENIEITKPQINNLDHWFNQDNLSVLGKIRTLINQILDKDIKDFLDVCFVSIIKKVSNADDISPKPYVSSKFAKIPPNALEEFMQIFKRYYGAITQLSSLNIKSKSSLTKGDALNIRFDKKIDLAITSPPYINAFDYARTLRLENLWLGVLSEDELREKKKIYVGTESFNTIAEETRLDILNDSDLLLNYFNLIKEVDNKRALIVKKFFEDMKSNLKEIYDTLVPNGHYVVVIGNSNIRKVEVESWKVIEQIAQTIGFETETYFNYVIQNPYIRIPRSNKGGKINKDNVLVLKKGEH